MSELQSPSSSLVATDHAVKESGDTVEMSKISAAPETLAVDKPTAAPQTKSQVRKERIAIATLCWCLFLLGWSDGATGPLLPRIQEHYHVGYAIVSLLFVFACLGCLVSGFLSAHITARFGFGTVIVLGAATNVVGFAVLSAAPPFPALVVAYCLNGFGLALQDSQSNGFVASIPDSSTKMGIIHAIYGAGALAAPLTATQFSHSSRFWAFQYLTALLIAISNLLALAFVFRLRKQDDVMKECGITPINAESSERNLYKQIFGHKTVHYLAFFIFLYVGVEVTIGGWIVTYVIDVRGGGPNSGYVSTGFFGGLTFGRVALLWINRKIGESRVIYFYSVLAIALEIVIWFVPSLIGDAIAVSFVGMLLGPFFPIAMNFAGVVLPHRLLTGSIAWIASLGVAGGAVFPFMTGALAQKLIAMIAFMIGAWALVPKQLRKND